MKPSGNYITVIVKPTDACNMRCKHCYHADSQYSSEIMPLSIFERFVQIAAQEYDYIQFIWHGGEPLLCGVDYFKEAINIIHRNCNNVRYKNSIQTNGTLINKEYIDFFIKNSFNVCVSYDGIYNSMIREKTEQVLNSLELMEKNNLRYSLLGTIHKGNVKKQIETYLSMKRAGSFKMNPIFASGAALENDEYLISAEEYVENFKVLFDYWMKDTDMPVHASPMEEYLHACTDMEGLDCIFGSCLGHWISLHANGDIYPCGRSYPKQYKYGNICDIERIEDLFKSNGFILAIKESIVRRNNCQNACHYYSLCQGGCNNNALLEKIIVNGERFMCKVIRTIIPFIKTYIADYEKGNCSMTELNPIARNIIANHLIKKLKN